MPSKQAAKQQYATMAAAKRDIKALFEAASRGDTATVEGTKDLDKYKDGRGRSCLHFAAASGSVDCAKRIWSSRRGCRPKLTRTARRRCTSRRRAAARPSLDYC